MLDQRVFSPNAYHQSAYDRRQEVVSLHRHREAAYALLRITVGIVFLFSGVTKLMGGLSNFASHLQEQFAGKLPSLLVVPFGYVLPFIETLIGGLLVLGLFNVFALMMAELLLVALTFGTVMQGEFPTVAHNVMYALIVFVLIWLANHNRYSVDRFIRGKDFSHSNSPAEQI